MQLSGGQLLDSGSTESTPQRNDPLRIHQKQKPPVGGFYFLNERGSKIKMQLSGGQLLDSGSTESTPQRNDPLRIHQKQKPSAGGFYFFNEWGSKIKMQLSGGQLLDSGSTESTLYDRQAIISQSTDITLPIPSVLCYN